MNSIGGNAYPGNHEQEPTEEQLTLLGNLVENKFEGIDCDPRWAIYTETDRQTILVSRITECIYTTGSVQKREVIDEDKPTDIGGIIINSDQVTIEIDIDRQVSEGLASKLVVQVGDDGIIQAFAVIDEREDLYGLKGREVQDNMKKGEAMVSKEVGEKLAKLAELLESYDLDNLSDVEKDELNSSMALLEDSIFRDSEGQQLLSTEEGEALSEELVRVCAKKGECYGSIFKTYVTANNIVQLERNILDSSAAPFNLGLEQYISLENRDGAKTIAGNSQGFIYFMEDGSLIFASDFMPSGPYGDYDYEKIGEIGERAQSTFDDPILVAEIQKMFSGIPPTIRNATSDDAAIFLEALQEDEVEG